MGTFLKKVNHPTRWPPLRSLAKNSPANSIQQIGTVPKFLAQMDKQRRHGGTADYFD